VHVISCPERDYLEKRIGAALHELAGRSRAAAAAAEKKGPEGERNFAELRKQHDILSERLSVLRDCLHLHKDWHGC
jgi:hypothetical protein